MPIWLKSKHKTYSKLKSYNPNSASISHWPHTNKLQQKHYITEIVGASNDDDNATAVVMDLSGQDSTVSGGQWHHYPEAKEQDPPSCSRAACGSEAAASTSSATSYLRRYLNRELQQEQEMEIRPSPSEEAEQGEPAAAVENGAVAEGENGQGRANESQPLEAQASAEESQQQWQPNYAVQPYYDYNGYQAMAVWPMQAVPPQQVGEGAHPRNEALLPVQEQPVHQAVLEVVDIIRVAAQAARAELENAPAQLEVNIGPPRDLLHPLFQTRRPNQFRVCLSNIDIYEVMKGSASIAGLGRLALDQVQYVQSRANSGLGERLGRVITGRQFAMGPLPNVVTAEYQVNLATDWKLIQSLNQFARLTTWSEFNTIVVGIEAAKRSMMQAECLGFFDPSQHKTVRLDYQDVRHEKMGLLYTRRPTRGDETDDPTVVPWHSVTGIDWDYECKMSQAVRHIPLHYLV